MESRISFVTLGVEDLARSVRFYEHALKLPRIPLPPGADVAFFEMGRTWLALYPRELLAADAGVPAERGPFTAFSLAHNVAALEQVDELITHAAANGGRMVKAGHHTTWGGYSGYFADPDGFLWEVAWNPKFTHV